MQQPQYVIQRTYGSNMFVSKGCCPGVDLTDDLSLAVRFDDIGDILRFAGLHRLHANYQIVRLTTRVAVEEVVR